MDQLDIMPIYTVLPRLVNISRIANAQGELAKGFPEKVLRRVPILVNPNEHLCDSIDGYGKGIREHSITHFHYFGHGP